MTQSLNLILTYVPTLLFLFIVIVSTIVGLIRGFRKSSILAIQALIAFIIAIIIFIVMVGDSKTDLNIVNFVNKFGGSDTFLQNKLGVSETNKTLKEILIEFIPKQMDFGDGVALIVRENGAYLYELVNLTYRIILAFIACIFYLLLVLFFYIIYVIFYPERRHRRKVENKYNEMESEKKYKKHGLLGMAIGFGRGLVSSIIILAFFGSFLYMVSGTGNTKYDSTNTMDLGDSEYSEVYDLYQSLGSYGTTGIYKVLNTIKNKDNFPYYLHAVDLVFSGNINDPNRNIKSKFNFADEMGAYTTFSRKTFDLLIKYGGEDIKEAILNKTSGEDMFEIITRTMSSDEFQAEFDKLIDDFDAKVYFCNFGLSLLDSVVNHIDELKVTLPDDAVELLKILFKKDYLSEYIPEEKALIDAHVENYETRPYIQASNILTKEDTKSLIKTTVCILGMGYDKDNKTETILNYSEGIIPALTGLSMFNDRKSTFNDIMARLYEYADNRYIQSALNEAAGTEETTSFNTRRYYTDGLNEDNIDWCDEIKYLLDYSLDAIDLYKNVYDKDKESKPITMFKDIFSATNPKAEENLALFDNIKLGLSKSKLLAKVLSSSGMYKVIEKNLAGTFADVYIPRDLKFANTYDANDNILAYGEIYNILNGLEQAFKCEQISELLDNYEILTSDESDTSAKLDVIRMLANILNYKDEDNKAAIDYFFESDLLTAIVSAAIISNKTISEEIELYIPNEILRVVDDEPVNIINNMELKELFLKINDLIDIVLPYVDEENEHFEDINYVINNENLVGLLDSIIIEGTVSNVLINVLTSEDVSDYIYVPVALGTETKNWLSVDSTPGETKKIISGIQNSGLNISVFTSESEDKTTDIFNEFKNLSEDGIRSLISSSVLAYSISGFIQNNDMGDFKIVVPSDNKNVLTDDVIAYVLIDDSLVNLINAIKVVLPEDIEDTNTLIKNLFINKEVVNDSNIINASAVNYLVNEENDIKEFITVNDNLKSHAAIENLEGDYSINAWNQELLAALNGLDEILEVSIDPDFNLDDSDALEDRALDNIKKLNDSSITTDSLTRLDVCYNSELLENTLTEKLKESEDIVVPDDSLTGDSYLINNVLNYNIAKIETGKMVTAINRMNIDIKTVDLTSIVIRHQDIGYIADSKIIRATMSKSLCESEGVTVPRDSETFVNGYISYDEMYKLLDHTMKDKIYFFGVENDDDPINILEVTVNQDIIPIGLLREMLESNILHATMITKLLTYTNIQLTYTLTADGQKSNVEQNFKTTSWYLNEEVDKLLQSMIILTGSEDSVISTMKMNSIILNNDCIDVLPESMIIRNTIYNKISDNLVIPDEFLDKEIISGVVEDEYINKAELKAVLTKLVAYKNTFFTETDGKINIDSLNINQDDLSIGLLENLISCDSFHATMILKVCETANTTVVIPNELEVEATRENLINNYRDTIWYQYTELANLFNSLELLAGNSTSKISSLDEATLKSNIFNLDINELYQSVIIDYSISNVLYDVLNTQNSLVVTNYSMDKVRLSADLELNDNVYTAQAVSNMINALKELAITDVSNIETIDYGTVIVGREIDFSKVYSSAIIVDLLTINLANIIDSQPDLLDHDLAWTNTLFDGIKSFYKQYEIESLVGFLNDNEITNINSFDVDDLELSSNLATDINKSYILRNTTTNKLITADLVIPSAAYDSTTDLITEEELVNLFTAVADGLSTSSLRISEIEADSINPNEISSVDDLIGSLIIKATITADLDSESQLIVINSDDYRILTTDYLGNNIIILSDNELKAIINVVKNQSDFEIEINYLTATIDTLESYMNSNILAFMITSQIGAAYNIEVTPSSVEINDPLSEFYGTIVNLNLQASGKYRFDEKISYDVINIKTLETSTSDLITKLNTSAFAIYRRSL